MICLYCNNSSTDVRNSRPHKKVANVWRRRHCNSCNQDFTTDEHPRYEASLSVRSNNGIATPFNRGILITSIAEAFRHAPRTGRLAAWDLSETIIDSLIPLTDTAVPIEALRTTCYQAIYRFDRAAGTQYAIAHNLPF